jgi:hypothetical protein
MDWRFEMLSGPRVCDAGGAEADNHLIVRVLQSTQNMTKLVIWKEPVLKLRVWIPEIVLWRHPEPAGTDLIRLLVSVHLVPARTSHFCSHRSRLRLVDLLSQASAQ